MFQNSEVLEKGRGWVKKVPSSELQIQQTRLIQEIIRQGFAGIVCKAFGDSATSYTQTFNISATATQQPVLSLSKGSKLSSKQSKPEQILIFTIDEFCFPEPAFCSESRFINQL